MFALVSRNCHFYFRPQVKHLIFRSLPQIRPLSISISTHSDEKTSKSLSHLQVAKLDVSTHSSSDIHASGRNNWILGAVLAVILVIMSKSKQAEALEEAKAPSIKSRFSSDLNDEQMHHLICQLIAEGDQEDILKLIQLLSVKKNFPNIKHYNWEVVICKELIRQEKIELIVEIFPYFQNQTLSNVEFFYLPIGKDNVQLVRAMVEGGMKVKQKENRPIEIDPFLYALNRGSFNVAEYFLTLPELYDINRPYPCSGSWRLDNCLYALITPAYYAVLNNDVKLLKWLLAHGADGVSPNQRPKLRKKDTVIDSDAPLTRAIRNEFQECFTAIINSPHCDINTQMGSSQSTPLLNALYYKRFDMAGQLMAAGADVNLPDLHGTTPVKVAVAFSYVDMLKMLLEYKANLNVVDEEKNTLWHFATGDTRDRPNEEQICQILKENGVDDLIDQPNVHGITPLADAIISKSSHKSFNFLLQNGANPHLKLQNVSYEYRKRYGIPAGEITLLQLASAAIKENEKNISDNPSVRSYYEPQIVELNLIITLLQEKLT